MPYDGMMMTAVVRALQPLVGQRVDKIYQPEDDEIHLQFRMKDKRRLKFSINPSMPYMTLTTIRKNNPDIPPNFLILMRKHLQGSLLLAVRQSGSDRIVRFDFGGRSELGDETHYSLIYELMGRHSNLIMIDETSRIIDSLKRVPPYMSQVRQVLPNLDFVELTTQQTDPQTMDFDAFVQTLSASSASIHQTLYKAFQGLSPVLAGEFLTRCGIDPDLDAKTLPAEYSSKLFLTLKNFQPEGAFLYRTPDGTYKDFHVLRLGQYPNVETRNDIFALIDDFYSGKDLQLRVRQHSGDLRKVLENRLKRALSKLEALHRDLASAEDADQVRLMGELLLANLHRIEKGDTVVQVENYYNGSILEISLDVRKTPQENSQSYYKKYNKMKAARDHLSEQIEKTREEADYFESILSAITNSTELDNLEMIREELIQQGYLRRKGYRKDKGPKSAPLRFISPAGVEIWVGKNNLQNDQLTFKKASNSDLWLHAKDIPGSHVIISCKGNEVDEETLITAAQLAALFSKARQSSRVPVDYTQVRHVKKPSGAKPGFVNYFHQQTLYVTPDEEELMKLRTQP